MLFLAGDSNYCKKMVDKYNNMSAADEKLVDVDFFKTLKGAWAWEIIMTIFLYVLAAVMLLMLINKKLE